MAVTRTQTAAAKAPAPTPRPSTISGKSTPPAPAVVPKRLSLLGLLDMIPGLLITAIYGIFSFWSGLFRGERDAKTLFLHIAYAVLRKATARLTPLQLQLISPNTDKIYARYARSKKITPNSVDLGDGAQGHWIGNSQAKTVLIWYHGGGYCLPANIGYFKFLERVIQATNDAGGDLAVFALTYTLAPHARYPTQLSQGVAALRYVLDKTGRKPGQVLLGGDSAGGNLVFGVLSHLAHPHSRIKALKISEPLAGAATLSAWTLLDPSIAEEQQVYSGGDIVTPYVGGAWGGEFLNGTPRDYYTDASEAPSSWFETYPVKQILLLGGENEILMPVIEDFALKLKAGFPNMELFVGKREAHVAPVYNIYVGDNTETEQGKKLKSWLRELVV